MAPTGMVLGLVVGILLAAGHHLFYASLSGTEAPTGTLFSVIGADVSRRQLNTAVGTAFAFLVKSALMITVSIAFAQAFWRAIRTSKRGPTLGSLDKTYSLLGNFLGMFALGVWREFTTPALIALIAWCIPIASIITPATLSVQTASVTPTPTNMSTVRTLDFTTLDFAAQIPESPSGFCFNGPSQPVQRIAAAVSAQGQILSIPAPSSATNASYKLDFWAPSLQCNNITGPELDGIWNNIHNNWGNVSDWTYAPGYLAWTGGSNSSLPFVPSGPANMFNFQFQPARSVPGETCTFFGSDSLIYSYLVADDVCIPGLQPPECLGRQAWLTGSTLLKCDLLNSSYSAEFTYTNGIQSFNVFVGPLTSTAITLEECFNVDGQESDTAHTVKVARRDQRSELGPDLIRLLSYQSIAQAFNQLLLGSVTMGGYSYLLGNPYGDDIAVKTPGVQINSSITKTVLMDTRDLAFVSQFNGVNETFTSLQTRLNAPNETQHRGVANQIQTGTRGSLKDTLEGLFQKVNISLLADDYLQPNYTSSFAPANQGKALVTYVQYHNIYIYSAKTLWAAYAAAVALAIVVLGIGLLSLALNDGSFANDFSTVLRVARSAPMSDEILPQDSDGRQPLPKHLTKARVMLSVKGVPLTDKGSMAASDETRNPTAETHLLPQDEAAT
ncbi:hypothetical protein LTS14_005392 [Recurvomyces mirabilis]|uniref:uncharacterized protein n=1 Tax=Recurvomyces mirabilis TaxID=574656 RepID=UPI002DE17638|nr:hypothetical protein LTS14_005392 [Recurvomyces mirabilis]